MFIFYVNKSNFIFILFYSQHLEKYPVVGKLLKPGEEPANYDEENAEDAEKKDN